MLFLHAARLEPLLPPSYVLNNYLQIKTFVPYDPITLTYRLLGILYESSVGKFSIIFAVLLENVLQNSTPII